MEDPIPKCIKITQIRLDKLKTKHKTPNTKPNQKPTKFSGQEKRHESAWF